MDAMNCLKTFLFLLLTALISCSYAQEYQLRAAPVPDPILQSGQAEGDYDMNVAKINLLALPLRSFSFQYERLVARKISVGLGLAMVPRGSFPMLGSFESIIDDAETFDDLQHVRVGGTAITLEPRFYFGKHDGPRGFYLAPYFRYSTYGLDFAEFEYEVSLTGESGTISETRNIPLTGRVNSFTGGILFGAQWRIAQRFYLDWWILGAAYGGARGDLKGTATLSPQEQEGLREALNELEIPMVETTASVDANGGRLLLRGPWAGARMGLAIGVAF